MTVFVRMKDAHILQRLNVSLIIKTILSESGRKRLHGYVLSMRKRGDIVNAAGLLSPVQAWNFATMATAITAMTKYMRMIIMMVHLIIDQKQLLQENLKNNTS